VPSDATIWVNSKNAGFPSVRVWRKLPSIDLPRAGSHDSSLTMPFGSTVTQCPSRKASGASAGSVGAG